MEAKKESAEKDEIINRMRLELENMRQQLHIQTSIDNTSNTDIEETSRGHTVKLLMQSHEQLQTKSKTDYTDPRRSMQHLSLKDARHASKSAKRVGIAPIHSNSVSQVEEFLDSYVPAHRPPPAATTSASTKAIRSTTISKANMAKVQQGKSSQGVFSRMHSVSPRFIDRCKSVQRSRGRIMQQQEKSILLNATQAPKRRTTKHRTAPTPGQKIIATVQNPKPEVAPAKPSNTSQKYGLSRKILSAEEAAEIVKRTFRERERRPDLVPSVTISLTK